MSIIIINQYKIGEIRHKTRNTMDNLSHAFIDIGGRSHSVFSLAALARTSASYFSGMSGDPLDVHFCDEMVEALDGFCQRQVGGGKCDA